jgi:hypothetical protein
MPPFAFELSRQLLRWLGVWLMTLGLPEDVAALIEHPEAVEMLAGAISYIAAEVFWALAKARGWVRERWARQ